MDELQNKSSSLSKLLASMREASTSKNWSRAIALCRKSKIFQEEGTGERLVLRLLEQGQTIARVVQLWPEEGDWNCDCKDREDPCIHSVASVIALKKALDGKEALPIIHHAQSELVYRWSRKAGFLYFDRVIMSEGGKTFRLTSSLVALR